MDRSLHSIMEQLKEIRNLKKKYPEATSFIKLSELYPDYSFDIDCLIPFKEDILGNKMKVFEEREFTKTIDTSILPIEYHSSYALGVSKSIEEFMTDNNPFFKTFLRGFDRIILGNNSDKLPGCLVISNYTEDVDINGYSKRNFIEGILKHYGIDYKENAWLVDIISGDVEKTTVNRPDYTKALNDELSFDSLASFYISSNRFDDLRFLIENKQSPRKFNRRVIQNEPIELLNDIVDNIPSIILDNIDILKPAVDDVVYTIKKTPSITSDVSCDKTTTVGLVKEMLLDLDPSGNFSNTFNEALRKGALLTYEDDNYVAYRESDNYELDVVPVDEIQGEYFSDFVNYTQTNTLIDVVDLMDGFIRYYMANIPSDKVSDFDYISEAIPAYFEYRTCYWLAENGFDEREIKKIFNARCADCLGTTKIDSTPLVMDLASKKARDGNITVSNILYPQQLVSHVNFRKAKGLPDISDRQIKINYAGNCADMVRKSQGQLDTNLIGASLGYRLGSEGNFKDMDQRIIWAIDNCTNTLLTANDLVQGLRNGIATDKVQSDEIAVMIGDVSENTSTNEVNIQK